MSEVIGFCVILARIVARQELKGTPLPQWLGLGSWEFVNPRGRWRDRGGEWVLLEGIYRTSAGELVALDWEQPVVKDLAFDISLGITCFCGCTRTFHATRGWHVAWVLIQYKICKRRWYCSSARWQEPMLPVLSEALR